jgi:hypothetical protein
MKTILLTTPLEGLAGGVATPGPCFWEIFPRKVEAELKLRDIAESHGILIKRGCQEITFGGLKVEVISGKEAKVMLELLKWRVVLPLIHQGHRPSQNAMPA